MLKDAEAFLIREILGGISHGPDDFILSQLSPGAKSKPVGCWPSSTYLGR